MVTRELPPFTNYTGGIGRRYAALAQEIRRRGHDVHVIVSTAAEPSIRDAEGVIVHLVRLPTRGRAWTVEDLPWALASDAAIRGMDRFDVVLAAEWGGNAWSYSRRRRRAPLVTNLATSLEQILAITPMLAAPARDRLQAAIQMRLERSQTQRSDTLIACSHAILDWAKQLWDLERVPAEVIPNFIDLERTRSLAQGDPPSDMPEKGPLVVYSGRLEERKGVRDLVRAMRTVWLQIPEAQLVMIGRNDPFAGGSMGDTLREIAGDHAGSLHLLGHQPPERLFPALARADLVVMPSMWEAFGIAALEAMALGRACILTSGSGFEEFFRDGVDGELVEPRDSAALADAIVGLLGDDPRRRACGAAACERADGYGVAPSAARYLDVFARAAGG
jgi:phosphatidylinositol alpha-mannosyltransferase